ncbi:acyltransferase family protein [Curtobacterium sp. MCBD17_003]|uniref:acyltransferase family protein n=1 Tax=Curtobacterium sp. MCBD17_003 TaxID=2175667 RepID=UPI000DAA2369|nr:acyltransferase family protein [Curtobacterium sp. MCBD17_003]WIE54415.1 acyltransferase family protein [Curtobacterium sp. MCBD17_003]
MRRAVDPSGHVGAAPFRPDIEGFRGIAVALVVAAHVLDRPVGGFVGVDVFFVVSGFVITTGLLREARATGTVDLAAFALRRARRVLPAAALTVLVTVALAWAVDHLARASAVTWDGVASMLMVQNWHLIRAATDYFGDSGAASPLQHFWSLAVEEQFYVFWPWVVVGAVALGRRRSRRPGALADRGTSERIVHRVLSIALGVGCAVSFAIACWETRAKPEWSYFSFESRAWELGVGAAAAVAEPRVAARLGVGAASVVTAAGLAAVLLAGAVDTPSMPFPGPAAALPVLGAAGVVLCGATAAPRVLAALTNPVSRAVGRWSYALYLWHLPVWSFLHAVAPRSRAVVPTVALGIALVLAVLTVRFVERPFRYGRTRPGPRPGTPGRPVRAQPGRLRTTRGTLVVALASALVLALSAAQFVAPGRLTGVDDLPDPGPQHVASFRSATALQRAVRAAVDDGAWGATVPDLDQVSAAAAAARRLQADGCLNDPVATTPSTLTAAATRCTFSDGRAARTLVVVGDSIAISWLPGIVDAVRGRGWRVVGIGLESCPASIVTTTDAGRRPAFATSCDAAREAALAEVHRLRPDLVVASSAAGGYDRQPAAARGRVWSDGTRLLARRLTGDGARVVLLGSPPEGTPVSACAVRVAGPGTCLSTPPATWAPKRAAERRALADVPRASFVDTASWFCDRAMRCPAAVGGIVVRADGGHLTVAYSVALARVLRAALMQQSG